MALLNLRNGVAWLLSTYYLSSKRLKHVKKRAANGDILLSVYFHNPSKKLFYACIKWFKKNGFSFISVSDLVDIIDNKLPLSKSSVVITVDDGWKENKSNIIEVAEEESVPVTIFISTEPVEKEKRFWWSLVEEGRKNGLCKETVQELKNVDNVERMAVIENLENLLSSKRDALRVSDIQAFEKSKYIQFGSHTVTHPILVKCTNEVSEYEIETSKQKLEFWLNKKIISFAYPNGSYTKREIDHLKNKGYQIAFNTVPKYIQKDDLLKPYELPRFDVLENVSLVENICRMTGIWFEKKIKF
jgi:peptidoglycan/xylan/chitin deacetylase (PgdA/CDA1 family)